jgi:hypothetical protein
MALAYADDQMKRFSEIQNFQWADNYSSYIVKWFELPQKNVNTKNTNLKIWDELTE